MLFRSGKFDLLIAEGERHTYVNDHPFNPNSIKAVKATIEFARKNAAGGKS